MVAPTDIGAKPQSGASEASVCYTGPKMQCEPLKKLEKVSQLLSRNRLTPDTNLEEALSSSLKSLVIPCHDKENRSLVIKILLSEDPAWRQKFFNEIQFYKTLGRRAPLSIPKVVKICSEDPLPFLLFEKIDGSPLSPTRIPSSAKSEWAPKLADLLEKIQNISPNNLNLPHYDGDFLIQKVQSYQKDPPVTKAFFEEVLSRLKESKEKLNSAAQFMVHGDFIFQNIIESGDQLIAIDWEFVGIGNRAYDAANLWLTTFKLGNWRKTFVRKVLQRTDEPDDFKNLLVLNLFRLYLREIKMWREVPERNEAALVQKTCEKELRLALKGFDALFAGD